MSKETILENLKLDPTKEHLYVDNKLITSQKTFRAIKEEIKRDYENPLKIYTGFLYQ